MPRKSYEVLRLLLEKRALAAAAMDVTAPASGNVAPAAHNVTPAPGINQIPPVTAQHTATTAMPSAATNKQQPGLNVPTRGPQNPAIAAAGQTAAKGTSGMGRTNASVGGSTQNTINSQVSRFGKTAAGAVLPTRQPMTGDQQGESVDDTVRQKMQYRWRDKMQKIDQGVGKLELQREQMRAEMQMEEEHLRQNEQLKAEQKQFDEQVKAQKQQQQMSAQMPQFPMGQQQAQPAMQQQQPGMARQMQGLQ